MARGDAAWGRRAQTGQIGEAVAAYEQALRAEPANLDAAWKLLRALHFQGEYVARSAEEKQKIFARGRDAHTVDARRPRRTIRVALARDLDLFVRREEAAAAQRDAHEHQNC